MRLGIPGPFHHHEVRRIVFEQEVSVFEDVRLAPSRQVEPGLRIQRIAVAGVSVLVHAGRDPAVLIGNRPRKPVEDDAVAVRSFDEISQDQAGIGPLINLNQYPAGHGVESFAGVIQVIPRRAIVHAADQHRALPGQPKLATVVRMFRGVEDPRAFITLRRSELTRTRPQGRRGFQVYQR